MLKAQFKVFVNSNLCETLYFFKIRHSMYKFKIRRSCSHLFLVHKLMYATGTKNIELNDFK